MRPWTLALVVLAGCYDWDVGPDAAAPDARATKDTGIDVASHDSGHESGSLDARVRDVEKGVDAPGHPDAASPCPALLASLGAAREEAQMCTLGATPPDCQLFVTDPCGCHAWVTNAAAQSSFAAAVMAYAKAGCEPVTCPESCVPAFGECLTTEGDAGTLVTGCYP